MKHKMLALILSLLLMAGFGHQVEAGFQDWLKDVAGKIGGEKALSDEDIVDGLKQATAKLKPSLSPIR